MTDVCHMWPFHVGSSAQTQIIRLKQQEFYLLSYLTSPHTSFINSLTQCINKYEDNVQ